MCVAVICLVYLWGIILKESKKINTAYIPVLCAFMGALLTIALNILHNENLVKDIIYGIMAGLSACGTKEITKLKGRLENGKNN